MHSLPETQSGQHRWGFSILAILAIAAILAISTHWPALTFAALGSYAPIAQAFPGRRTTPSLSTACLGPAPSMKGLPGKTVTPAYFAGLAALRWKSAAVRFRKPGSLSMLPAVCDGPAPAPNQRFLSPVICALFPSR